MKYLFLQLMKKWFTYSITIIAFIALFSMQGIWLYNTYTLLNKNLLTELEEGFARSIEKEIYFRFDANKHKIQEGTIVSGARPDQGFYSTALSFHEFLLSLDIPLSLDTLDSFWSQKLTEEIGFIKYMLLKTDSAGKIAEKINRGVNENSPYTYIIERPVRSDDSEYLRAIIESPYKVVLAEMLFLVAASLIIAMILIYCLFLQLQIIIRQERIAENREDFMHATVHGMKNPVTGILMSAKVLRKGQLDSDLSAKNKYCDIVIKEGNRLLLFAEKILKSAELEDAKIKISRRDINLSELVNRLKDEYLETVSKEVRFMVDVEDSLCMYADPAYMDDVFRNLIENAIKYSNAPVNIHIRATKDKKNTIIKLKDNGTGISPKDQKRIFKKFQRARDRDRDDQKKDSFGIGLYYVYQVVTAHGGRVKVESIPKEFSEFTIRIPNRKV